MPLLRLFTWDSCPLTCGASPRCPTRTPLPECSQMGTPYVLLSQPGPCGSVLCLRAHSGFPALCLSLHGHHTVGHTWTPALPVLSVLHTLLYFVPTRCTDQEAGAQTGPQLSGEWGLTLSKGATPPGPGSIPSPAVTLGPYSINCTHSFLFTALSDVPLLSAHK